ncbi:MULTISPECIES: cupin domain-containing protein [Halomicrobium]|uniref:Cupin domain-containing protein n=1 Tax=Halomicrobium mukohataei TaxID=57705 RepID=A0A847UCS4_9EURY|nr:MULTISPECIES: cupin domain-containing protein [Halomicrobium]NLV10276.1 cupin domain-containing protein [Halomicrobium mukohataei]QGA82352.1 Cupin domain [Halomicrobium sp. LC1Hm]
MSDTELVSLDDLDDDGRATLFEHEPHTVRLSLAADEGVPAHQHPDRQIVFHQLSGELDLHLGDEVVSLTAGDVVRFDGDQDISPQARTDSEALLVLAPAA